MTFVSLPSSGLMFSCEAVVRCQVVLTRAVLTRAVLIRIDVVAERDLNEMMQRRSGMIPIPSNWPACVRACVDG